MLPRTQQATSAPADLLAEPLRELRATRASTHERRLPPWRVVYLVSHPIQYQAPLLAKLSALPWLDLRVAFQSDVSTRAYRDAGFGRDVDWDVPLCEGYRHRFLPGARRRLGRFTPWNRGLSELLAAEATDALWLHGYTHPTSLRALRIARRRGIPVLVRGESNRIGRREAGLAARGRHALLCRLFRRVDRFLAIGSANREFYLHHGVSPDRIHAMPYAVDNERFRAQCAEAARGREAFRRELNLDPARPTLLFVGKLAPWKGAQDLLAAVERLYARPGDAAPPNLVVVGDGELSVELRDRGRRAGLAGLRFLGFRNQTELPRCYDLGDLLCVPSHSEPWGLVVNEGMCAARPVLASRAVGAARDLVREGETGALHQPGDVDSLEHALRTLCGRADARDHLHVLGSQAAERVATWDFEANVRGLFEALQSIREEHP